MANLINRVKPSGIFCIPINPRSHRPCTYKTRRERGREGGRERKPVNFCGFRERERREEEKMLLKGCNAADQLQTLIQCRFLSAPKPSTRRGIALVCCSSSGSRLPSSRSPDLAVSERTSGFDGAVNGSTTGSVSLADRLRLGSLTEDGLSYKENFIVRCYEVGINKTATVETIANLLQVIYPYVYSMFWFEFLLFIYWVIRIPGNSVLFHYYYLNLNCFGETGFWSNGLFSVLVS